MPTLHHPITGKTVVVSSKQARVLKQAGWVTPQKLAHLFDPSEHTVDEVNAYLAGADDAERDRVIAVESAGKARTGITSGALPPAGSSD